MHGQQRRYGDRIRLDHRTRFYRRGRRNRGGRDSRNLHQHHLRGGYDRRGVFLALRLLGRRQLVGRGRTRSDRLQSGGRIHGDAHGVGRRRQPRDREKGRHRAGRQRRADGRFQLLADDGQRRRRGDLHRQVDRFRWRDRLARMGVPRRFDLDGDESLLHLHAEGHVPGQADRRRRPRR